MAEPETTPTKHLVHDLISASIVFLLDEPIDSGQDISKLVRSEEFLQLIGRRIAYAPGIAPDAQGGLKQSHTFESVQTHKVVAISPNRVEAHDRSGQDDMSSLAELAFGVQSLVGVKKVRAVGVNFEIVLDDTSGAAGKTIAQHVLSPALKSSTAGMTISGASAKFFLTDDDQTTGTLQIEPRWNDVNSPEIWISTNTNMMVSEIPTLEALNSLCAQARAVVAHVLSAAGLADY
jgi:hypothetical protein